jgi:hypothetical protein
LIVLYGNLTMISFKEFFYRKLLSEQTTNLLFEHELYKLIPGTRNSYRQDSANTSTLTQVHSHVYAKAKGRGSELYSVNFDGSGHDGSSKICIPSDHADFFRSKGYSIAASNILECVDATELEPSEYTLIFVDEVPESSSSLTRG